MLLIRSELIILNIMDRFTGKGELSMVIPPFLPESSTFPLSWIASTGLILLKELGTLKAVGYGGGQIVMSYVLQFLFLGLAGGMAGTSA